MNSKEYEKWEKAIDQIGNITYRNLTGIYDRHRYDKYYKVALMIVPSYINSINANQKNKFKDKTAEDNAKDLFEQIRNKK
ncbi:MAG: hypothetical protein LUC34_02885 [Campylobacter sp.]|nr:hypothetical protein [Campylobacter sp.]